MTTLFLQRHVYYSNPRNIMPFRMPNMGLSDEGKKQIESLSEYYRDKNISAIYASPMQRSKETAELLATYIWKNASDQKINFASDLLETFTPVQGILLEEYDQLLNGKSLYANEHHLNFGGETIDETYFRMNRCIEDILNKHKDENILITSHADPMAIYSLKARGKQVDANLSLWKQTKFIPMGGTMRLTFGNEGKFMEFEEVNY